MVMYFRQQKRMNESIRPCILKLKEENQEKLKSGEATQRRVDDSIEK